MNGEAHLLRPEWLLAALPVAWLLWRWARSTRESSEWSDVIAAPLLDVLLERGGRRAHHQTIAVTLGLTLALLALAGPAWQRIPQPVEQRDDALVIVLDLSLSMLARDVPPSRIALARREITDLLRQRTEGTTALIAYAGDAHTVVPLTDDVRTIENLLGSLAPTIMPVLGSRPDLALELAVDLFDNAKVPQGRIVLVTDGVDRIDTVTEHRNRAYPISILGIGTDAGARIPLDDVGQPGRVLTTNAGDAVIARLDSERLAVAAEMTHGVYRIASPADDDVEAVSSVPLPMRQSTSSSDREFDTWYDGGFWLLLIVLPLLLLSFRRGQFAGVALIVLLPDIAHASFWDDLWTRPERQAYQHLRDQDPELAASILQRPELADSPWAPVVDYRNGDYDRAAQRFAEGNDASAHYNRGNALARAGELEAALTAYAEALARDPTLEDAVHNRRIVEELLQQQKEQDGEGNEETGDGEGGESDQQRPDTSEDPASDDADSGDNGDPDSGEPQPDDGEPQPGDEQVAEARDEGKDATEAWLRRVPDDPGGLLKRKFQYETNQRLRSGSYRKPGEGKIW